MKENFFELCLNGYISTKLLFMETSDIERVSSKEFLDIQATIKCRFTLKRVHDMIITCIYS